MLLLSRKTCTIKLADLISFSFLVFVFFWFLFSLFSPWTFYCDVCVNPLIFSPTLSVSGILISGLSWLAQARTRKCGIYFPNRVHVTFHPTRVRFDFCFSFRVCMGECVCVCPLVCVHLFGYQFMPGNVEISAAQILCLPLPRPPSRVLSSFCWLLSLIEPLMCLLCNISFRNEESWSLGKLFQTLLMYMRV